MLYPIVTETHNLIDINGVWNFKFDLGVRFEENWQSQKLKSSMMMAVPVCFNDVGVTTEIRNHVGQVWYEREFSIPALLTSGRIVLRFGSKTHVAMSTSHYPFLVDLMGVVERCR